MQPISLKTLPVLLVFLATVTLLSIYNTYYNPPTIPREPVFTKSWAEKLARLSLSCTQREYPNKLGQVLKDQDSLKSPKALHPAFYGCFDWHSAVHGHWALVRLLKRFPKLESGPQIRALLNRHLTRAKLERERMFFLSKYHKSFERPYGWAWYLRLVEELETWKDPDAQRWRTALRPLEQLLVQRIQHYLKKLSAPIRAGTHASTAFALTHIYDYAQATQNKPLLTILHSTSQRFYLQDKNCPLLYEPSGEDFLSPCLAEADLMRRILPKEQFEDWLDDFLPPYFSKDFKRLATPPNIKDPKDFRIGHLIGLYLQRSWTMRGIASALPPKKMKAVMLQLHAIKHRAAALRLLLESGYGGHHWLASFAIYDLTNVGIPTLNK